MAKRFLVIKKPVGFADDCIGEAAAKRTIALVPHLFGETAFQEFPAPMAAAVWFAERPLGMMYAGVPFQAISESTADDLALRGIPRGSVEVIYPGIDSVAYTPKPAERAKVPTFSYLGRLKKYKGVHLVINAFARTASTDDTPAPTANTSSTAVSNPATAGLRRHQRNACSALLARRARIGRSS